MRRILILLAGLGLLLTACSAVRTDRVEARYPPVGAFVETPQGRVHYVERGQGRPIVLVHGASGNLRDMMLSPLFAAAAGRGRVIAFDRPGFGYTDRPDGMDDPREQARFLSAALDELAGEPAAVVGHSYAGSVAMAWALERPEQVAGLLILSGVTHRWPGDGVSFYNKVAAVPVLGHALAYGVVPVIGPRLLPGAVEGVFKPQPAPPDYAEEIGAALTLRPGNFRANARDLTALKAVVTAMSPRYDGLTLPIEIVHGEADDTVYVDVHGAQLVEQTDSARLTRLPGIGHMPHHVAPDAVIAGLDRLLARLDAAPASP